MIYKVVNKENIGIIGEYGDYATKDLAQEVVDFMTNHSLKNHNIKINLTIVESPIFNTKPEIYTHIAKLKFNDINNVDVRSLSYSRVVDDLEVVVLKSPFISHHMEYLGLQAYGISENDAKQKVKQKMVNAIQNGTYGFWKEAIINLKNLKKLNEDENHNGFIINEVKLLEKIVAHNNSITNHKSNKKLI